MLSRRMRTHWILLALLLTCSAAAAETIVPREWLLIGAVNTRGRRPFNPDAIFQRYLLDRDAKPPVEGEKVEGEEGRADSWKSVIADESGQVKARARYAYTKVRSERAMVALARLPGGGSLFVNGDAFVGDIYGNHRVGVPVALRAGDNHIFVRGTRGSFRLELEPVAEGLVLAASDATLPDLVAGQDYAGEGSVVVVNASPRPVEAVLLTVEPPVTGGWDGAPEGLVPLGLR